MSSNQNNKGLTQLFPYEREELVFKLQGVTKLLKTVISIIILLSCISNASAEPFTDLDEYGLKGEVRIASTKYYSKLENRDGTWVVDEKKMNLQRDFYFDRDGWITKIITTYYQDGELAGEFTIKVNIADGKKESYRIIGKWGRTIEQGEYTWLSDTHYKILAYRPDGTRTETSSELDSKGRDWRSSFKEFKNNKLVASEKYVNEIGSNGRLISSTVEKLDPEENHDIEIVYDGFDETGNILAGAKIIKGTGELLRYMVRTYTYY